MTPLTLSYLNKLTIEQQTLELSVQFSCLFITSSNVILMYTMGTHVQPLRVPESRLSGNGKVGSHSLSKILYFYMVYMDTTNI